MELYSHKEIKDVYVVGCFVGGMKKILSKIKSGLVVKKEDEEQIHPKELEWLKKRMSMEPDRRRFKTVFNEFTSSKSTVYSNSVIIITGDAGFGTKKEEYYNDILSRLNNILKYNNTYIYFIRGNHDNPDYFENKKIDLSNIKTVQDYSVIETANLNFLCVGGALSIDRRWRKEQENRLNKLSGDFKKELYWDKELPIFNGDKIAEICKNININCVATHTVPSFITSEGNENIDEWAENDEAIISDSKLERTVMDRIFETLRDNSSKPIFWAYSHFHTNHTIRCSDTIFKSLDDNLIPINVSRAISSYEHEEKMIEKKRKSLSLSFLKRLDYRDLEDGNLHDDLGADVGGEIVEDEEEPRQLHRFNRAPRADYWQYLPINQITYGVNEPATIRATITTEDIADRTGAADMQEATVTDRTSPEAIETLTHNIAFTAATNGHYNINVSNNE